MVNQLASPRWVAGVIGGATRLPALLLPLMLGLLGMMVLGPMSVSALYGPSDAVIQLDGSSFAKVLRSPHVVVAEFYAPWCGHCKNLAPEYKQAAKRLNGLAKLVSVDCDQDKNKPLCSKYDVRGFPTIKIFSSGSPKGIPEDYRGERTAKGLVKAVLAKLPTLHVKKLGKGTNMMPVKSFIEDAKQTTLMLVHDKPDIPYFFRALSLELKDQISFGFLRSDDDYNTDVLKVKKFPYLILIPRNGYPPAHYSEDMNAAKMAAWVYKNAGIRKATPKVKKPAKPAGEGKDKDGSSDGSENKGPAAKDKKVAAEEYDSTITQLLGETDLGAQCVNKAGVCIIAFLGLEEEVPESVAEHKQSLELLSAMKLKYFEQGEPFNFVWVNALQRGKRLMRDFDVADQLPGLVAVNSNKKVFRNFRGGFDKKTIARFLDDLYVGRGRNFKYTFSPVMDEGAPTSASAPEAGKEEL